MGYKAGPSSPPHNEGGGLRFSGTKASPATAQAERAGERTMHSKVDVGYGVSGNTGRGAKMPRNAGVHGKK